MTTFAEYIFQLPGVIVIHPRTIDTGSVINSIITQPGFAGQSVAFITNNKKSINLNLPDELFFKYSDNLSRVRNMNGVVFVDSLFEFLQYSLNLQSFKSHLVILTTLGVEPTQIALFPSYPILHTAYIKPMIGLQYDTSVSNMNATQQGEYEKRRKEEEISSDYKATQRIPTLQIGNFVYPNRIQELLNLPSTDPRRKEVPIDDEDGWITPNLLKNLKEHSRKFTQLLNRILTNSTRHHLIYTRFKEHYGAYLISSLLKLLKVSHIMITGNDKITERRDKIRLFNVGDISVLLTTVELKEDIENIHYVHFVEGHDINIYNWILNVVYKRKNYELPENVEIVDYIAQQQSGEDGADGEYYRKYAKYVYETNTYYEQLINQSKSIVIDADKGLIVVT